MELNRRPSGPVSYCALRRYPLLRYERYPLSASGISFTMRDSHSFEVRFEDGSEVEFDKKGNWKEVDCKRQAVPASVLSLVPAEIQTYAAATFPQVTITKINQKHWGYEVELSNGFGLEFDKKGKFLRMDD